MSETKQDRGDENREQPPRSKENPLIPANRRTRRGRKRTMFHKAPRPAWPVRGLWENAPEEEKKRAHTACMKILEYWLGKKSKAEVAAELLVSPLTVWQLSQKALSGMLAGLLKQPRSRVGPEVFEASSGESPAALKRRIVRLEQELSRTEDLVRVLRTAPWMSPSSESPSKGVSKRGQKTTRKRAKKARVKRDTTASRPIPQRSSSLEGDASGAG